MRDGPQGAILPDGRLHLHHGPIDLIITAEGAAQTHAFEAAQRRFETILTELMDEYDRLSAPYDNKPFNGPVARRMHAAIAPLAEDMFITPMAAVAGAVADEVLSVMPTTDLAKASVNNGGDIAFSLTQGEVFRAASPTGLIEVEETQPVRGMATSGWRGRSQSLGIADAVTALGATAARADAAATLIANAVDLPDHPAIERRPARDVEAMPQLGDRLVTTNVGALGQDETRRALERGADYTATLVENGLISAASLLLNGEVKTIGSEESVTGLAVRPS